MSLRRYTAAATPPWLLRLPRLAAAYLALRNHDRATLLGGGAMAVVGAASAWLLQFAGKDAARAALQWSWRHVVFLGSATALVLCVLIARRRAATRSAAARSWLAAVPVGTVLKPVENGLIESRPALVALLALTILYALLRAYAQAWAVPSFDLTRLWLALISSVCVGALASYLVPNPKEVDLPPGSRYVPQLRRTASLHPSLRPLGSWPIRQAFARAQPRVVARASMPVLMCIGMGTSADAAMLTIAAFAVLGFSSLLVISLMAVSHAARRWLLPLPLRGGAVLREVALRSLALMLAAAGAEAALFFMQGAAAATAIKAGLALWLAGWVIAIGGSVLPVARRGRS